MLNIRDLTIHAKAVAEVVKSTIAEALSPVEKRLDAIESLPRAEDIKSDILAEVEALIPEVKDGNPGEKGDKGDKGDDGKSIDIEEIKALIESVIPEVKDGNPGEKGDPGKDADPEEIKQLIAAAVAEIPPAKDGEPGTSVALDDVAPMIDEAVKAAIPDLSKFIHVDQVEKMINDAVSRALESIELPKNGDNGRDALDIEILPAIEESKNYPRGTYASHNGGLWKSYQMTVGMKGWECIVDGVASISVDQKGEREFSIDIERSNGIVVTKSASVPVLIYRGVYSQKEYSPGDTVTWDGSLWHCDTPTSDKPGEHESKGWSLCAKRGRNGKDGVNGIDKAPRVAK